MKYDIIVLGAGPAGISAAVYAVSRGKRVLILEKNKVGGIIGKVSTVTHYTGIIEEETGETFSKRMESQALKAGVEIQYEEVTEVLLTDEIKIIRTNRAEYQSRSIIIANGSSPRKLGIPGELELAGHGIGLNAAKDGAKYKGKHIYVVGGADGAIKEAIYLAKFASKLTIIHFEKKLGAIPEFLDKLDQLDQVDIKLETRLTAVMGQYEVEKLELTNVNTGVKEIIEDAGCGVFIYAGIVPNTKLYESQLELKDGYLLVDENMQTNLKGVFGAGDIRHKQVRQVATAVSDGAIAAINVCKFLD